MASKPFKTPPVSPRLAASGFSESAKTALMDFDAAMFQWHRMHMKGELTGRFLSESGIELEPALFQGLLAVVRITHGIGRPGPSEPTVGLVAEDMAIDPSRASRITSELISRGFVERSAAQDDGRKSVLLLTDKGRDAFTQVRDRRWAHLVDIFSTWEERDIECFTRLFGRYVSAVIDDGTDAESDR